MLDEMNPELEKLVEEPYGKGRIEEKEVEGGGLWTGQIKCRTGH